VLEEILPAPFFYYFGTIDGVVKTQHSIYFVIPGNYTGQAREGGNDGAETFLLTCHH